MGALYNDTWDQYDASSDGQSVQNILARYRDIVELLSEELKNNALPYFIDWLTDNVTFVEIRTDTDEDAYTIFETMNDRGLNLTPTDMLKGYLLSKIELDNAKLEANKLWRDRIFELKKIDKDEDLEFFRSWLRAKYAQTIRPGRAGAENEDFEKIATRFHHWVRDNKTNLGLSDSSQFFSFIKRDFIFFSTIYSRIDHAANHFTNTLEHIFYLQKGGFARSFYFALLMAPIQIGDDDQTVTRKLALVARFLETFLVNRAVNKRTLAYSSIRYTMFSLIKDIRNKSVQELAEILKSKVKNFDETLAGIMTLGLHGQNRRFTHFLLARITRHVEERCNIPSSFWDYVNSDLAKPYQIEHIWSDTFEAHKDEFTQSVEFDDFRNRVGDLILIPEGFNQSYGELPYEQKLPHYYGQNMLAKTLSPQCYTGNPSFLRYVRDSGLPFSPHEHFKKNDLTQRQELYKKICEEIWSPNGFDV